MLKQYNQRIQEAKKQLDAQEKLLQEIGPENTQIQTGGGLLKKFDKQIEKAKEELEKKAESKSKSMYIIIYVVAAIAIYYFYFRKK